MTTEKDLPGLEEEQVCVSRKGVAWTFENLRDSVMFWIRKGGMVKELTVRLKQDGEEFPLEWFYEFRVTLWLQNDTEIVCDVVESQHIKRSWFFLILEPTSAHEEDRWATLQKEDVSRIEIVAGEERSFFVWQEDLRLFKRQTH